MVEALDVAIGVHVAALPDTEAAAQQVEVADGVIGGRCHPPAPKRNVEVCHIGAGRTPDLQPVSSWAPACVGHDIIYHPEDLDMADITASMVKDLRDRTGAGMMDCKKALNETNGDMETAVDWLRTKGLASAAKKAGRTAAEGLVGVTMSAAPRGAVVEVNSETDFVAKNDQFQSFVRTVTGMASHPRRRRRGARSPRCTPSATG